jgi:hypothetical protein
VLHAQTGQDRLDGQPPRLADHVADQQHPARARGARRIPVDRVPEPRATDRVVRAVARGSAYFAYSTARVSRMTVTLIWPG